MKEILVDKVYDKAITWMGCPDCKRKVCNHGKGQIEQHSTAYTVSSDGTYYSLKGWGQDKVKEGDTIRGEVTIETYTKDGEQKEKKVLTLPKPELVTKDAFDALESRVLVLEKALFNEGDTDEPDSIPAPEISDEDIPF